MCAIIPMSSCLYYQDLEATGKKDPGLILVFMFSILCILRGRVWSLNLALKAIQLVYLGNI